MNRRTCSFDEATLDLCINSIHDELKRLFVKPSLSALNECILHKANDHKKLKMIIDCWNVKEHSRFNESSNAIEKCNFVELRTAQNKKYSMEILKQGLLEARIGKHVEALKKYDSALEMDASNVDARVARGVSLSNMLKYEEAIEELTEALKLSPSNENAKRYLELTKHKKEGSGKQNSVTPAASSTNLEADTSNASSSPKYIVKKQFKELLEAGTFRKGKKYDFEFDNTQTPISKKSRKQ